MRGYSPENIRKLTCPQESGHFKRKVALQPIFSVDMLVFGGVKNGGNVLLIVKTIMTRP